MPDNRFATLSVYGVFVGFSCTAGKGISRSKLRWLFHKKAATLKLVSVVTRRVQIVFYAQIFTVATPLVVFFRDSKSEI